jgi:UDP-N-acetylmuramate dehydrogenase
MDANDAKFVREMLANSGVRFRTGYPLARLTTFGVGGPASFFAKVRSVDELKMTLAACRKGSCPVFIVGTGSNLLASDAGFRGAVIRLEADFRNTRFTEEGASAGAGTPLSKLCRQAAERGLAGFEFAHGIPGTVGGALWMNAGAYGTEILDLVTKVTVLDAVSSEVRELSSPFERGYRRGPFASKETVVLSAEFLLRPEGRKAVEERCAELAKRRRESQPVGQRSAGSVFKNPQGRKAWELILEAGCKGLAVGGAKVSEKHANFFVNAGGATGADIRSLVDLVRTRVREKCGIELETEVEFLGDVEP